MYGWLQVTDIESTKEVRLDVELATVPDATRKAYETCAVHLNPGETVDCGPINEVVPDPGPNSRRIVLGGVLTPNGQRVGQVQTLPCPSDTAQTATSSSTPSSQTEPGCK